MTDTVSIQIEFDPIFGGKAKDVIARESSDLGRRSGKEFSDNFGTTLSRALTISAGVAINDLFRSVKSAISQGAKGTVTAIQTFERIETSLKVLTGSVVKTDKLLRDLQDFAATTPFELVGISKATTQLLSFGFGTETILDRLQKIGDVAAGSNSQLTEVAVIYGQIGSAGRLTGERLLQLQERAIPIGSALAKTLGVAESQIRQLVSEGRVSFRDFEKAFNSLSGAGGAFSGALVSQSRTVGGILSTLRDNFFNLQIQIGKTFSGAIISVAKEFIGIFQKFSKDVVQNGPIITRVFQKLADLFLITPAKFWADLLGGGDATRNIAAVNNEAQVLSNRIDDIVKELNDNKDGLIFNSFIGKKGELQNELAESLERLTELKNIQAEFAATQITSPSEPETPTLDTPVLDPIDQRALDSLTLFGVKLDSVIVKANKFAIDWAKVGESVRNTAVQGIGNGVAGGFAAVGAALAKGENALEAFGKAFAAAIGQAAIQLGTRFILEGIAISFNPFLGGPAVGGPLIAAGAALATFGGALGAVVGGAGGAGGTGGSGLASSSIGESITESETVTETPDQTSVNLIIQGDVLDGDSSALRIASLLNTAFDKQGVVLKGAVA